MNHASLPKRVFICGGITESTSEITIEVAPDTKIGICKMKRVKYLLLAMLAFLLVSCIEKPKTLKPVSSRIEGPLADYFEVVVKDYRIVKNQVYLEFVRIKEGVMEPEIIAEFLDGNGNVLGTSNVDISSSKDELRFLLANKVGESSTVSFAIGNVNPTQVRFGSIIPREGNMEAPEVALETDVVSVDNIVEETEIPITIEEGLDIDEEMEDDDDEEEEDEIPTQSIQSSNSRDWDKVLDDFESYVDHYISLLKKATNGDLSALTEYAVVLEKAEKLEKDLNAAQNEMTNAQMKRYVRITKKMTDAAFDMYDKMY